jgi:hypothetical protein
MSKSGVISRLILSLSLFLKNNLTIFTMKKIIGLFAFTLLCNIGFAQTQTDSIKVDAAVLQQYAGTYKFTENFQQVVVEFKNGDLYAEVDQYGQNRIIAQKDGSFKSTSSYGTVYTFLRNAEKNVKGVKLELMGQSIEGVKE